MTATDHKNWLQAFDHFYEFYCQDGEGGDDAATYAVEDADKIYRQEEQAA